MKILSLCVRNSLNEYLFSPADASIAGLQATLLEIFLFCFLPLQATRQ